MKRAPLDLTYNILLKGRHTNEDLNTNSQKIQTRTFLGGNKVDKEKKGSELKEL